MPMPNQLPLQGQKPANVSQTVKQWGEQLAERAKAEAEKQLKVGAHDPARKKGEDYPPGWGEEGQWMHPELGAGYLSAEAKFGPPRTASDIKNVNAAKRGHYAADDFLSQLEACDEAIARFSSPDPAAVRARLLGGAKNVDQKINARAWQPPNERETKVETPANDVVADQVISHLADYPGANHYDVADAFGGDPEEYFRKMQELRAKGVLHWENQPHGGPDEWHVRKRAGDGQPQRHVEDDTCWWCSGKKVMDGKPCRNCNGSGQVTRADYEKAQAALADQGWPGMLPSATPTKTRDAQPDRHVEDGPQRHSERPPPISKEEHLAIVQGMKPAQRRQLEQRGFTQATHPKSGEHGTLTVTRGIAYWDPHPPQASSDSWTRYAFSSADGTENEQTTDFFDDELKRQRDQQRRERQKTMQSTNPTSTASLDRNFLDELRACDAVLDRYAATDVDRHGSWSPHHRRVLSALDEAPGAGAPDLAHALGMNRRDVQAILEDLHDDDHVVFANGGYHARTTDDDEQGGTPPVDRHGNAPIGRPAWPDDRPRVTVYGDQLKHWGIGREGQANLESGQRLQTKHPLTGQSGSISKRYYNEYIFEPEQGGTDRHTEVPASMRFLVDRLSRFTRQADQVASSMLQHESDRASRHAASLESIDFVPGCYSRNLRILDAIAKGRYRASREVINRAAEDAIADLNGTFRHGDTIGDAWRHVIEDAKQDALSSGSNAMHYRAGVRTVTLHDVSRHTTMTDKADSEDELDGKAAAKKMDPDASQPATLDPDRHFFDELANLDRFTGAGPGERGTEERKQEASGLSERRKFLKDASAFHGDPHAFDDEKRSPATPRWNFYPSMQVEETRRELAEHRQERGKKVRDDHRRSAQAG